MMMVENRMLNSGRLTLNVFEWGHRDHPPVVLLHGLASTSHMFDLLAQELSQAFHVVSFDQRGHGLSEKPDSGYDFESISLDIDALMQAIRLDNTPFDLAGHSWGASTALYYAASRPNRIKKVILIDGGLKPARLSFPNLEAMTPPQRRNWTLDQAKKLIREEWLGAAWRPELESLVLSIYDLDNPNDIQPRLRLANHMQIAQALWDFNPADYFQRIRCPILIVNAIRGDTPDPQLIALGNEVKRQNPNCDIVWMTDTIHDIPWQRSRELAEIMKAFLVDEETG